MMVQVLRLTRWEFFKVRKRWIPCILLAIAVLMAQLALWENYSEYRNGGRHGGPFWSIQFSEDNVVRVTCVDVVEGAVDAKLALIPEQNHQEILEAVEADGVRHFFLELERRAEGRERFLEKLRPYLRYYASGQPLETFGAWPSVLFAFRDEIAETGFLRWSEGEAERYGVGEVLPVLTTTEGLVAERGPLSAIWRSEPGGPRTSPWPVERGSA